MIYSKLINFKEIKFKLKKTIKEKKAKTVKYMGLSGPIGLAHLKSTRAHELNKILFIKKQPSKILKKSWWVI